MALATRWRRPVGFERLGRAADREVVGLGAAAGEHDLRRVGVQERRRPRTAPSSMAAFACWPKWCTLDALPKISRVARDDRLDHFGARGVVAL